mmetsp:Transcript_43363/g.110947  ORF Transcript_43363/g.110947 Transcript_43363/m.110947 type:complete len:562 (+) Transcript_43363:149-1834(+)
MSLWTTSAGLTSRRVRANPSIQLPGSSTVLRGAKPFRVPAKRGAVPRHTRKAATCSVHRSAKVIMGDGLEQRFEIKRVLGQGGFGIVHEVVSRNNNNTYAIKTMRLPRNLSAQEKQQAEIDVLTRVGRCLNICTLYEVFKTPGHLHMVMEACTGGTLASRLADESDGHYSEARVAELMRDILRTVAQCHKCSVVHRDIKPENFLFHHEGEDAPLKAIDFGLAVYAPRGTVLTERCGTSFFMAPEVIDREYGPEADVWAAGVSCYLLLSGQLPFKADNMSDHDIEEVFAKVKGDALDLESGDWKFVSQGAKDFVASLLQKDPRKRPTAVQALQNPWVREGGEASAKQEDTLSSDVVRRLQMFGTFNVLKKTLLRKLAGRISNSRDPQVMHLRELFTELGGTQDSVTFTQFRQGLSELVQQGGNHLTDAEVWEMASQLETDPDECAALFLDGDGPTSLTCPDIKFEDLLASLLNWETVQKRDDWREMVEDLFSAVDTDSSGELDLDELHALLPEESVAELREVLNEVEGAKNGRISLPQFMNMLSSDGAETLMLFPANGSAEW